MKTHEIAKVLSSLAQVFRDGPNVPIETFGRVESKHEIAAADIPTALSTLVALAEYDKSQWQSVITEYDMPIVLRPKDASRDILGKILKYLEENPSARNRLAMTSQKQRSETSPELMRALQFLLKT